jgi:hypothetical protein
MYPSGKKTCQQFYFICSVFKSSDKSRSVVQVGIKIRAGDPIRSPIHPGCSTSQRFGAISHPIRGGADQVRQTRVIFLWASSIFGPAKGDQRSIAAVPLNTLSRLNSCVSTDRRLPSRVSLL